MTDSADTVADWVAQLSAQEKADLCSGLSFWEVRGVERLGLPSIWVTDGPHGLRKQQGDQDAIGLSDSVPAVCFPTSAAMASTWDPALLRAVGEALGDACNANGVSVLLGPGANLKRSPLCGRNFEYFSEDPFLTGQLAAAWVEGVQSRGVGASLKHFAVNNQESQRMVVDAIVDERTLRELYLPGFEICVKQARPWTVMCAYNKLNGTYLSDSARLLQQILRDEWGHQGIVVSDWGATNDRVASLQAGMDLEMPGNGGIFTPAICSALEEGRLDPARLDAAAAGVLRLLARARDRRPSNAACDLDAQHALAGRVAEAAMVLLRNQDDTLPLKAAARIAVVGALAKAPRYQGTGSSKIRPTRLDIPLDEIAALWEGEGTLPFAPGYRLDDDTVDTMLIDAAVSAARGADCVVVFAGLPDAYESEGFDRTHMRLPANQLALIDALCDAGARLVVVLQNGAPVALPFRDRVAAILESYLGGQAGGGAVARVLFGRVNPSGRLAETFPLSLDDVPAQRWFPGSSRQVQYREALWVGYRYFTTAGVPVAYPFGHGLSYTRFRYAALRLSVSGTLQTDALADWTGLTVSVDITNTGPVAGTETVQLYVGSGHGAVPRPARELRQLARVHLAPGETRTVHLPLGRRAFAHWDVAAGGWRVEAREVSVEVGASCEDIRLSEALVLASSDAVAPLPEACAAYFEPARQAFTGVAFTALLGRSFPVPEPALPLHRNSTIADCQGMRLGRLLRWAMLRQASAMVGDADPSTRQMLAAVIDEMPLRNLVAMSQGRMSPRSLDAMLAAMNQDYRGALRSLLRR